MIRCKRTGRAELELKDGTKLRLESSTWEYRHLEGRTGEATIVNTRLVDFRPSAPSH